ncbi:DoxX family protein [Nocardia sp. CA-290969]|uniref:DoxX family protein n=1 Tax=Nocardia sp. CA-290969 TaxID=3239986 RepID=UPI003D92BE1C
MIIAITVFINAAMAIADLVDAEFVQKTSGEVGLPPSWIPKLGVVKLAGALGLLVGALVFPILGIAAAAGLVLFFVLAVATHIRARVFYNIFWPLGYLAFAVASFVLVTIYADTEPLIG